MLRASLAAAIIASAAQARDVFADARAAFGDRRGYTGNSMRDASDAIKASEKGSDNDEKAAQAYGRDKDSRWGRTYDRVQANSFDTVNYEREIWADDDEWAESGDAHEVEDAEASKEAASAEKEDHVKTTTTVTVKEPEKKKDEHADDKKDLHPLDTKTTDISKLHDDKVDVHEPAPVHKPTTSYKPTSSYGVQSLGSGKKIG